jgi:hypothetical protein
MINIRKVKCVSPYPEGSLKVGEIYTIIHKFQQGVDTYYSVAEIDNGNNSYYSWRFKPICNMNKIRVL